MGTGVGVHQECRSVFLRKDDLTWLTERQSALSIRKQVGFPKWNWRETSINKMKAEFSFYDGQLRESINFQHY